MTERLTQLIKGGLHHENDPTQLPQRFRSHTAVLPAGPAARADCLLSDLFHGADTALPPKPLTAKVVDANPFMGRSESNIHHDCYNTDSTDAILPVGICPEVNVAMEKTNPNASPAIFFDNFDNPVSPFLGGLAIRDLDAEEVRTIGFFSPAKHDGGGYLIQSSYSFVDGRNLIVCPTSHNHVLMLRATDENGTPLPVFEKVLDINIKEAAERVLGRSLEQNLLSAVKISMKNTSSWNTRQILKSSDSGKSPPKLTHSMKNGRDIMRNVTEKEC